MFQFMRSLIALAACSAASGLALAGEVQVAVAANFIGPMQQIAADFEHKTGDKVLLSSGATGKFYAQIKAGAPFDILLAADDRTPARLVAEGDGIKSSQFTYAIGKLVLWSASDGVVDANGEVLKTGRFNHLSICNPQLAPYGEAAVEAMKALGTYDAIKPKLVTAENVAQAQQFVATGNAELGFVALSQVSRDGKLSQGSAWVVPANLYSPIRQDAVLLVHGKDNDTAHALLDYLRSEGAKAVIHAYGYGF